VFIAGRLNQALREMLATLPLAAQLSTMLQQRAGQLKDVVQQKLSEGKQQASHTQSPVQPSASAPSDKRPGAQCNAMCLILDIS
jgi:hypothetical protein